MRLDDCLKLPKESHSLAIIKEFLEKPLSHHDYQAAFSRYFEIAIHLKLYALVFEEGNNVLKELSNQQDTPYYEKILKHLIDASIELKHFDLARDLIHKRRQTLTVMNQYLSILDEIKFKQAIGEDFFDLLLKIKQDTVPTAVRIYCLEELFKLYYNNNEFENALSTVNELYGFDLKNKYLGYELKLLLKSGQDQLAQAKALDALTEDKKNVDAALVLIEIYLKNSDFQKAETLEADFEAEIDLLPEAERIYAYNLIMDVYDQTQNKLSYSMYQKKLKALTRQIDKKDKDKTVVDKDDKDVIIIEKASPKNIVYKRFSEHLDLATDWLLFSHLIDDQLPLREYLRTLFMNIDNQLPIKEYVLYLDNESPNLFHYKKERLYDKTILPHLIEHTLIEKLLRSGEDLAESTTTLKWTKNVITQKEYEGDIGFIYAFSLADRGVIEIRMSEQMKDPGIYYDLLKLLSTIIHAHLIDEDRFKKYKKQNSFYKKQLNSPLMAIRILNNYSQTYNEKAQELLSISEHEHLEIFLKDVSYDSIHQYKEIIAKLLQAPNRKAELLYNYQNKSILEKFVSFKQDDEVFIMSTFIDQTKEVEKMKELVEKATLDLETGIENLHALSNDFQTLLTDKASLIAIEFNQQLKSIYAPDQFANYFKEFTQNAKKHFDDGRIFRIDFYKLLVILPYNDIRTVTKKLKDFTRYIRSYKSLILPFETFNFKLGVLRYPVVTVERNMDKLLRYLDVSIENAKKDKHSDYNFFVHRDYEDELFEQQVIDHLNLAIESKQLTLVFRQIIDLNKHRIWQYESDLFLPNLAIDSKYLFAIAKKRLRLVHLERFHIEHVCSFLNKLETETERLIRLTIPVSKETFLDPTFNSFLVSTLKNYGIPPEFIRLKCEMDTRITQYIPQIHELAQHGISLDTTEVEMAISYPFHAVHLNFNKDDAKWFSYIKMLKKMFDEMSIALVLRNVQTKEQKEKLELTGVTYIEGPLYKDLTAESLIQKIKESIY
ncbi:MAG: EAL domain-containing protein [Acholeplasmataceae bacterium]